MRATATWSILRYAGPIGTDRTNEQVKITYKTRLKDGQVTKLSLAVRQDNPQRRWHFGVRI